MLSGEDLTYINNISSSDLTSDDSYHTLCGEESVSEKTVSRIIQEGKMAASTSKKIVTTGKSRPHRKSVNLDSFDLCAIRQKIHQLIKNIKILILIEAGLPTPHRILQSIGFRYKRCQSKRKILTERYDITAWRTRYIEKMLIKSKQAWTKAVLFGIIKENKGQPTYVVDELLKSHNHEVLRLLLSLSLRSEPDRKNTEPCEKTRGRRKCRSRPEKNCTIDGSFVCKRDSRRLVQTMQTRRAYTYFKNDGLIDEEVDRFITSTASDSETESDHDSDINVDNNYTIKI
ncbi:hypothetical protein HW555_000682 [Spodoptera exigua]|uniref:Uncharacterized protein n=1 Tax=Spodoptera exigua TaxID=7107 RepID=A0A835GR21_SPOEX|nr:hypothetical protein HW555_000682 [Spodoptera exigua]